MKKEENKNNEVQTNIDEATRILMPRRRFLQNAGIGLGAFAAALGLPSSIEAAGGENFSGRTQTKKAAQNKRFFRFAVIADTHIIDDFYTGPESNALDTESILQSASRLKSARTLLNNLNPPVEKVFVVGDYFHDYPSTDYDFYYKNKTRIDNAKELTDGFEMPVHVGFGNHDYMVPKISREMSHRLFKDKLGVEPYYSVSHRDYKFVHLNNFIGETWNSESKDFNKAFGTFGETQLNWFEAELKEQKPTFVFVHYPLYSVRALEVKDYGILPLLKKYKDTIQLVVSGHWHRWFDFARTFGAQHYVMGSTRYDEDAYMIIEVDTKKATHRILNLSLVDWATHYSLPFREA